MKTPTDSDPVHAALVKLLDTFCAGAPRGKVVTLLHLGCGVPLFLRSCDSLMRGRLSYRGVDESETVVREAGAGFPHLPFVWRQLDSMPRMAADILIIGPGIFRMCGGGAAQLLRNAAAASCSILAVATVPGADNSVRESLIQTPRSHVALDAMALRVIPTVDPPEVIPLAGCVHTYAVVTGK